MITFANLFLIGFALDGAVSVLDELARATSEPATLSVARAGIALVVLLTALGNFFLLAIDPRLPKRILLPLIAFLVWCALGAYPLSVWARLVTANERIGAVGDPARARARRPELDSSAFRHAPLVATRERPPQKATSARIHAAFWGRDSVDCPSPARRARGIVVVRADRTGNGRDS